MINGSNQDKARHATMIDTPTMSGGKGRSSGGKSGGSHSGSKGGTPSSGGKGGSSSPSSGNGGNWPSTTGNQSGGGRGNNAPKR